ncbi:TrmH family RNA methyltransferase [Sphingomonas morindae]|uniref:RNA methyltransferase n=1 Tax=Sphingomonas morindae TaxID=1541170 RepID=A0ABY4XDB3_9SPHN|nr:RNA methyltransferase [Sphingomonas morindae]USI74964.1 RNA methyltransferase [Sphingomonas morindae]
MARIVDVADPEDPRLAPYHAVRERDLIGRDGLFIAEGRVVIEKMAGAPGIRAESLLIAAHRLDAMADILARLPADTPVYAAAQPVIDRIAGFAVHRGLLATGRRIDPPDAEALLAALPPAADVLLLSGIANHDNMGGLFRNAAAFGVAAVLLDADCCDPLYRKAIRVSVGAALLVPFARLPRDADLPALLATHGFRGLALSPRGATLLAAVPPAPRTALLLGAEGPGLDADLLRRVASVRIPMAPGFDSLNVATASGIVLHHLLATRAGDQ